MTVKRRKNNVAELLEKQIFRSSRDGQVYIYNFVKKSYFIDLGYDNLKSWANANRNQLNRSYDSLMRDYHAACITADMKGEEAIGEYTSYSLLPMKGLEKAQRSKVYKYLKRKFDKLDLSAQELSQKAILSAMQELKLPVPERYMQGESTSNSQQKKLSTQDNAPLVSKEEPLNTSKVCEKTRAKSKIKAVRKYKLSATDKLLDAPENARNKNDYFEFMGTSAAQINFFNRLEESMGEEPFSKSLAESIESALTTKSQLQIANYLIKSTGDRDLVSIHKEIKSVIKKCE